MSEVITSIGDVTPHKIHADTGSLYDQNMFRPSTIEKVIYEGDTPTFEFTIKQNGLAKNLIGLTVGFGAKVAPAAGSSFLFNVEATITSLTNGEASATLTSSQTTPDNDYVAEVTIQGSGTRLVALQFPLIIVPRVT